VLESLDGRPKLEQIKPVLAAKKPVFVDKPMAGSLHDVAEMFAMARKAKTPIFSSSSLRFRTILNRAYGAIGTVTNAETYGRARGSRIIRFVLGMEFTSEALYA